MTQMTMLMCVFGTGMQLLFHKILNFILFIFLDCFDVLILKINLNK